MHTIFFISFVLSCTCFGCYLHPSSGAQQSTSNWTCIKYIQSGAKRTHFYKNTTTHLKNIRSFYYPFQKHVFFFTTHFRNMRSFLLPISKTCVLFYYPFQKTCFFFLCHLCILPRCTDPQTSNLTVCVSFITDTSHDKVSCFDNASCMATVNHNFSITYSSNN
jgi:hypothetical protein